MPTREENAGQHEEAADVIRQGDCLGQKPPCTDDNRGCVAALDNGEKTYTDEEAIACSLENPEACEACD